MKAPREYKNWVNFLRNERHSVVIDIENTRIGCSDCDEWDYLILKRGDDAELFCKVWLENHLKRLEDKDD